MNDNQLYTTPRCRLPEVFGPWPPQDAWPRYKPSRYTQIDITAPTQRFRRQCEHAFTAEETGQRFIAIRAALTAEQNAQLDAILEPVPFARDGVLYRYLIIRAVVTSIMLAERERGTALPPEKLVVGLRTVSPKLYQHFAVEPLRALNTFYLVFAAEHRNLMRTIRQTSTLLAHQDLPEFKALYSGPDAMRAYIANGGTWHDHGLSGAGSATLAHFAATTTTAGPDLLTAFIQTGGHFHSNRTRDGDTPLHWLMANVGSPQTLLTLAQAGLRFEPSAADAAAGGGETPRGMARQRSQDDDSQSSFYDRGFADAFDHLLMLSERRPCRN